MLAHYDCMTYIIFLLLLWLMIYPIAYTKPSPALGPFFKLHLSLLLTRYWLCKYTGVAFSELDLSCVPHTYVLFTIFFLIHIISPPPISFPFPNSMLR
ncbi:hypothetical protein ASPSYDRAFT_947574 [Aspergillus sydowii CBS 593.65]|uniref:Uncharacterized protein n=1 Tax=Aspergillus sydowii CBS 593.65 TaxID=1036612 RepID=A0A1L9TGP2_9EURO|nr:uncharacterized protein ASPSYDRAFT_947574 [Aspergillus sydowii CBS 593.65]OJJ58463.1 hypothetical protein ASPSYDRAFT_947574 [Aspergillus sydowii CBS 593.65]